MYSNEDIMQFVNLVAEVSDPNKIILFGSSAYGNPTDKSDIDLLVIKNGNDFSFDEETDLATAVYLKREQDNIRIRYDVFFRTDRQVKKSCENGGAFVDAMKKGELVYERANQ